MDLVQIEKVNEVYNKIIAEPSLVVEMAEYFTFDVPGAKFMPAVRNKFWDGKIRLLQPMSGYLYAGLNRYVEEFCKSRSYQLEYITDFADDEFSIKEAKEFISTLKLTLEPREIGRAHV